MNGAAVLAEVIEIGDILSKGEEADWDVRTKAMIKLQELAPTASKYDSFATGLDKIKKHLVAQLNDLRSQVIKEICMTVGVLAQSLAEDFDSFVGLFFQPLLRLTGVKTLVMSQAAHDSLLKVMEHASPAAGVEAVLSQATTAKGPKERARCMEYLSLLLDRAATESLERHRDLIASTIVAGMSDASPEARSQARACFQQFAGHWDDRAAALKETLDSSIQRALARDAQAAASKKKSLADSNTATKRRAATAAAKREQPESLKARIQQAQRVSVQTDTAVPQDVILVEHRPPVRVLVPEPKALPPTPAIRIPVERSEETAVVPLLAGAERIPAPPTTPLPHQGTSTHRPSLLLSEQGPKRAHQAHTPAVDVPGDGELGSASTAAPSKAKRVRLARIPAHKTGTTDSRSHHAQQPFARHAAGTRAPSTPPAKRIAAPLSTDWEAESGHLTAPIPMLYLVKAKQLENELPPSGSDLNEPSQSEPALDSPVVPSPTPTGPALSPRASFEASPPVELEKVVPGPSASVEPMNIEEDQTGFAPGPADDEPAFDVSPHKAVFDAALDILVQLPAAAPLEEAVHQARASLQESAQDCIERTLTCIVIASRNGRMLAARRALEAFSPLLHQPHSLPRLARAAVGLLAIDEDRQYVFSVMHQILLLLPRVVELDVTSLHTLISAVLTGMDDSRVEVRKASTDVAAVLWVKLGDAVLPLFSRLSPLASRMLSQRRDQAHATLLSVSAAAS